jgi:hypothetical protein
VRHATKHKVEYGQTCFVGEMEIIDHENDGMLIGYRREKLLERFSQPQSCRFAATIYRERQIRKSAPDVRNCAGELGQAFGGGCGTARSVQQSESQAA